MPVKANQKVRPRRVDARVVGVHRLGEGLGRVDLEGEGIGRDVLPGLFAMVEATNHAECVLLRPYSYFLAPSPDHASLLVKNVGTGTRSLLEARPTDVATFLGPLGAPFPQPQSSVWMVAGGVGAAPFGVFDHDERMEVLFGARTAREAGFADALKQVSARVHLATDDGSAGFRGSVIDLLHERLESVPQPEAIYTCGPTGMMAEVSRVARERGIRCWASLEERMGCGIGVCRGCAHRDAEGGWRIICLDGPVYDAREIFG